MIHTVQPLILELDSPWPLLTLANKSSFQKFFLSNDKDAAKYVIYFVNQANVLKIKVYKSINVSTNGR